MRLFIKPLETLQIDYRAASVGLFMKPQRETQPHIDPQSEVVTIRQNLEALHPESLPSEELYYLPGPSCFIRISYF